MFNVPFYSLFIRRVSGHFVFLMPIFIHNFIILYVLTNNYVCVKILASLRRPPEKLTGGDKYESAQSSASHATHLFRRHRQQDLRRQKRHGVIAGGISPPYGPDVIDDAR